MHVREQHHQPPVLRQLRERLLQHTPQIALLRAGLGSEPRLDRVDRGHVGVVARLVQRALRAALASPQLVARGFFQEIEHPAAGTHPYPGPMAQFSRTPLIPTRSPAPLLGQHNEELLRGLVGLDEAEYAQLVEDQIVGTAYLEDAR